jgi:hypothetical protein
VSRLSGRLFQCCSYKRNATPGPDGLDFLLGVQAVLAGGICLGSGVEDVVRMQDEVDVPHAGGRESEEGSRGGGDWRKRQDGHSILA